MRRTWVAALVIGILGAGVLVFAEPDDATPDRPAPRNLRELDERLADLAVRVQRIIDEAAKDPDAARIRLYTSYTPKQMQRTRGRVRAEDLLAWMLDPNKNFETVRRPAQKALIEGSQFRQDPELSKDEKQGSRSRLANFCIRHVVKHLEHENRISRGLVHELLLELWFGKRSMFTEIDRYDPGKEATWDDAKDKWRQILRKR